MARNEGVIPTNDEMFNNYYKYLAQLVAQRTAGSPPEWPHVPAVAVDRLADGYAGWYTVYALTLKPHTPLDTLNKNRAKEAGTALAASFLNEYIRYLSHVSEADKASLGVFAPKPKHRIEPPRTVPVLEPHAGPPGEIVSCFIP